MDQKNPAVAADCAGNFVVVWMSYYGSPRSYEILGRRFDADGNALGDEFQINTTSEGNQSTPAVAMDGAGNFVVVWQGPQSSIETDEDIFGRRFDANGAPLCDEFCVNTGRLDRQLSPRVAAKGTSGFVVVWESENIPVLGKRAICGQLYDSSGGSIGGEFVVNEDAATCRYPDVIMHGSGEFVVVWLKESSLNSVWKRSFEADGSAPYLSSKVNESFSFTSLTRPSVAMDSTGAFVVVWDGHPDTYLQDDVYLKRYHWTGAPIPAESRINEHKSGAQRNPSVAMNAAGEFVALWQSETAVELRATDIIGQRFPSQGENLGEPVVLGDQFGVNTYIVDHQESPDVVMTGAGRFVMVWASYGQDGSGWGIFAELGPKAGSADLNSDGSVDFRDESVLAGEWGLEGNPLEADLADDNRIDESDLVVLCEQWLKPTFDCGRADLTGDGKVDFSDYAVWSAEFTARGPGTSADFTGDGVVDMADLAAILFSWTKSCQ
jgi:hypothetical protein